MSRQTAELLDAFHTLPFDSGPLDDDETVHAADQLLAGLDAEEDDDSQPRVGL